jgi:hypothetical protein
LLVVVGVVAAVGVSGIAVGVAVVVGPAGAAVVVGDPVTATVVAVEAPGGLLGRVVEVVAVAAVVAGDERALGKVVVGAAVVGAV